ncbi:MAG TPA: glycosyltransferase family 4 protein, partial [Candidatus Angelobacter sp.]|nr:glycosyltransferase family 4 protein [Candidatus Angelobacter sp.]
MADRIKVLLLPLHRWVSTRWGSELAWAFNIASSLATCSQLEITALVGNIDNEDMHRLEKRINVVNLGLPKMDALTLTTGLNYARFQLKIATQGRRLVREIRPDLLHHVFPMGIRYGQNLQFILDRNGPQKIIGPLLYPVANESVQNMTMSPAGAPSMDGPVRFLSPLLQKTHEMAMNRASLVLYDSSETAKLAWKKSPRLSSIPWRILATGGHETQEAPSLKLDRGLTIGSLHYLRRRKRMDLLLRALSQTREQVSAIIGGTGPEEQQLRRLVIDLGLTERVRFFGHVSKDQEMHFWGSVDMVVSMDPVPPLVLSPIQEAMMAGRAFVASGPESAAYHESPYGIVLGSTETRVLSQILDSLALNPQKRLQMSREARKYALENFTTDAVRDSLVR